MNKDYDGPGLLTDTEILIALAYRDDLNQQRSHLVVTSEILGFEVGAS